jgi:uncharacterized membrane protein
VAGDWKIERECLSKWVFVFEFVSIIGVINGWFLFMMIFWDVNCEVSMYFTGYLHETAFFYI